MSRLARGAVAGGAATALILGLGGCGLGHGLYNVPLPGGADVGNHPYSVTAEFDDALDLVPQAGVRVNDVAVGRVTSIDLEPNGKIADVVVKINGSVHLPANAIASIQQTSLLGEKYVELAPPSNLTPEGTLRNGATIDVQRTTTGVEVEQVLGALSLLLNGGGIGQLHEIAQELNQTTSGHEVDIRRFFERSQQVIGQLNHRRGTITRALDGLANLSGALRRNNTQIAQVLRNLSPGLAIVAKQESQLRQLLVALTNLSRVTVSTLNRSRRDIVDDLRALAPVGHCAAALAAGVADLPVHRRRGGEHQGRLPQFLRDDRPEHARRERLHRQRVAEHVHIEWGDFEQLERSFAGDSAHDQRTSGAAARDHVSGGGVAFDTADQPGRHSRAGESPGFHLTVRHVWRGSLMLTRTTRFQLVAFVVIALLGISYVAIRYVGVLRYVGASGYTVKMDLPQAGGIFSNAEITYRGVPVGRVGDMRLTQKGIQVDLEISTSRNIPSNVTAVVANRSVIGEQYVDLRPHTKGGPYLSNGSLIAEQNTATPPLVQNLLRSSDDLARSVPIASLQTVVNEIYSATQGVGPGLGRLITSNRQFFSTASDSLPQTIDLINTSKTVLATQNSQSDAIMTFSNNLALIGQQLRDSNGDIDKVLTRTSGAARQFGGLIRDVNGSARALLSNLLVTSTVFLKQKDRLEKLLVNLPVAVSIGGSVVTPQGVNVGLIPTFFDPLPCTAGYGGTKVRTGLQTSGNPALNTSAGCTASPSSGKDVRGAQSAPGR